MSHLCIIDDGFSRRRENDFVSVWILCCLRTSTWDYIIIFVTFCFCLRSFATKFQSYYTCELVCGRFDTKSLPPLLSIDGGGGGCSDARSFYVRARYTDFFPPPNLYKLNKYKCFGAGVSRTETVVWWFLQEQGRVCSRYIIYMNKYNYTRAPCAHSHSHCSKTVKISLCLCVCEREKDPRRSN